MKRELWIRNKIGVTEMSVTGITDQMMQYERGTEVVYNNKPKSPKKYGIKTPDTGNVVAVLAGLFLVLIVIDQFM